ncbi:MAG: bifunctional UDP-sugar hydrolase/5'-nucleotidase [Angelakisella sp.]
MSTAKKRIFSATLALVMVGTLLSSAVLGFAAPGNPVVIYHTNDMHSNVTVQSEDVVKDGFNLAHVKAMKDSTPGALLLDAGDATQGKPLATLSKGNGVVRLMNAVGYDGMVLGNHEFDYGQDALLKNVSDAAFPIFAGNVAMDAAKLEKPELAQKLNTSYVVKEVNGYKIAIFGVVTPETAVTASPANQKGIKYEDVGAAAKKIVDEIKAKEKVNAIICLSHCGIDPSVPQNTTSMAIAEACGGDITAIIDGHSHTVMMGADAKTVKGTKIVSTGSGLKNLGKLELTFDAGGKVSTVTSTAINADTMAKVTPDAAVAKLIADVNEEQKPLKAEVVGKSAVNLYAGNVPGDDDKAINVGRLHESNLCNLVTDSYLWYTNKLFGEDPVYKNHAKLAYSGGGGVRVPLEKGEITMEEIMTVLPYSNEAYFLEISPATLYRLAEVGVSKVEKQDTATGTISGANGRFVQPAGFKMEVDYRNPPIEYNEETGALVKDGSRILKLTLDNGTVLDRKDEKPSIILLSNSYDFGGGDGHFELKEAKLLRTDKVTEEILADYIRFLMQKPENKDGFTMPLSEGRIILKSGYTGTGFDLTVTDATPGTEVKYAVSGKDTGSVTVGAAGTAVIQGLANGPQEITVTDGKNTHTRLVDNYVGFTSMKLTGPKAEEAKPTAAQPMANPVTAADEPSTTVLVVVSGLSLALALGLACSNKQKHQEN